MNYGYNNESLICTSEDYKELVDFLKFLVDIKGLPFWFTENWIKWQPEKKIWYIKFFDKSKQAINPLWFAEFEKIKNFKEEIK